MAEWQPDLDSGARMLMFPWWMVPSGPTLSRQDTSKAVGMDEGTGMGLGREEAIRPAGGVPRPWATWCGRSTESQWTKPSRCEGWQVGDVARHVVGTAADVAAGQAGSHTPEEEVAARKSDTPAQLADELEGALGTLRNLGALIDDDAWNGPSPVPDLTMRQGILVLLYDAYVHGDDIRAGVGLPSTRSVGLDASVEYLGERHAGRGWGPATAGPWTAWKADVARGKRSATAILQFVLAALGRAPPAGLDRTVTSTPRRN